MLQGAGGKNAERQGAVVLCGAIKADFTYGSGNILTGCWKREGVIFLTS